MARDFLLLALDVSGVFGRDLDLLGLGGSGLGRVGRQPLAERRVSDAGAAQKVGKRVLAGQCVTKRKPLFFNRNIRRSRPSLGESLRAADDCLALALERGPANVVDDSESAPDLGEPQV